MTRIALMQLKVGRDKQANVERGLQAIEHAAAQGAALASFAELAFEPFYPQLPAERGYEALAESVPVPTSEAFAALSRRLGVVVVLNLFERAGGCCYDA
jgi:predicted amidohydrolase